jgi:hypothetical protein
VVLGATAGDILFTGEVTGDVDAGLEAVREFA